MSSSSNKNEVPVEFKRSASENADSNENIEKQIKGPIKVTEQNGNNKHVKKEKECRRPSKKRWLVKLSVANLTMGLMNIAFGIAVFIESKELSYWLTSCAFSIWYGCLVLGTGVVGLEFARRRSKARGIIHILLNTACLLLTIASLAFYGKVVTHYHKIRKGTVLVKCSIQSYYNNCNAQYENLATKIAALYGILLVSSVVEIFVCFVICARSSAFRIFCKKIFLSGDNAQAPECSMYYPGSTYFPSGMSTTYHDFHIDPAPLKPVKVCEKVYKPASPQRVPSKPSRRVSAQRKRSRFVAMESITESIEGADGENETPVSTKEEEERYQREGLLPQTAEAI